MFEINFLSMFEREDDAAGRLRTIVERVEAMAGHGSRAATTYLMDEVGLITDSTKNEAWYEQALNYSLALAHIFLDEPEEAAGRLARSGVLPGGGGAFVFSEAINRGLALAGPQEAAIARHVPTVILSSMPRAASAALATTLSVEFGAPAMRASAGRFPDHYLMPCWLARLARGGAILHDHFGAGPFNLAQIRGGAVGTVFVLLRDPRAAAVSFVRHMNARDNSAVSEDYILQVFEQKYLPWVAGWLDAAAMPDVAVQWIDSYAITSDPETLRRTLAMIVGDLAKKSPLWSPPDMSTLVLAKQNFVSGTTDGWRASVSSKGQERMWAGLRPALCDLLDLKR